jgi:hypothetical protein
VPIGSAWTGDATREFLSIAIDDPSFKTRMNIAAFKNREGGYDLTWPGTGDSIMNREQLSLLRLSSLSPKIRFPSLRPLAL